MRSLVVTILLAALASAALPAAQAQVPTASMTVAISGLPAEMTGLASNATAEAPFKVDVQLRNVVCPAATTIPVAITVTGAGAPAFLTFTVDPADGAVTVPAGPQTSLSGSVESKVVATLKEITANATVPVEVKATATPPSGCQGAGNLAAQEATAMMNATVTMPAPPPAPPEEPAESPGPGAVLGVLAAMAAAALRRRRCD